MASGHSRARKLTGGGRGRSGEDGESFLKLTRARKAARWPSDSVKVVAEGELTGGGARGWREG
jgi:hypothetical protein